MTYHKRFPVYVYHKIARKLFEKEIDEFFNNTDLIKTFGGELHIKPYKAFVKNRDFFEEVDWYLLSKDKVKEVLNEFGAKKYCIWYYYNTKFKICLLINCFFWEYIYAIIGKQCQIHRHC